MSFNSSADHVEVAVYSNHSEAEAAVDALKSVNISLENISIIGGHQPANEASLGDLAPPEFVEEILQHESERTGIWIGGLFGLLVGFGSFLLPGVGLLYVLGPLTGLAAGIGAGAVIGGISGGLTYNEIAADYRNALKDGSFLVIAHCTPENQAQVLQVFQSTNSQSNKEYPITLHDSKQAVKPSKANSSHPYSDTPEIK